MTTTEQTQRRTLPKSHLNAVLRRSERFGGVVSADALKHLLRTLLSASGAPTQAMLSKQSGVSERTISRVLNARAHTTRFDIADALLVALGSADSIDELLLTEGVLPNGK